MYLLDLFEKNEDGTWKLGPDKLPILTPAGIEKIRSVFGAIEKKSGVPLLSGEQFEKIKNLVQVTSNKIQTDKEKQKKDQENLTNKW